MGYTAEATDYEVLEPDTYDAVFVSVTPSTEDGQFGPYLDWKFSAFNPESQRDVDVTGRSSPSFGPTTKAREWLEALIERPLTKGERIDLDSISGRPCRLLLDVVEKEKGTFNRIEKIMPPKPAPKSAVPVGSQAEFEEFMRQKAAAAAASAYPVMDVVPDGPPPTPTQPAASADELPF